MYAVANTRSAWFNLTRNHAKNELLDPRIRLFPYESRTQENAVKELMLVLLP